MRECSRRFRGQQQHHLEELEEKLVSFERKICYLIAERERAIPIWTIKFYKIWTIPLVVCYLSHFACSSSPRIWNKKEIHAKTLEKCFVTSIFCALTPTKLLYPTFEITTTKRKSHPRWWWKLGCLSWWMSKDFLFFSLAGRERGGARSKKDRMGK